MNKEEISLTMLDLLANHATIQDIINKGTEFIGNPLLLADSRFRILFVSKDVELNINLWKESLIEGYISDEVLESMEKNKIIAQLKLVSSPIKTLLPNGYYALRMPLFYNGKYCGFLGTYSYLKDINKEDEQILVILSKTISSLLHTNNDFISYDENAYESYLHQLLQASTKSKAELVCRKNNPMAFGRKKVIICIEKKGNQIDRRNIAIDRLKDILRQNVFHHYCIAIDDCIILLLEKDKLTKTEYNHTIKKIEYICKQYNLIAGISYEFEKDIFVYNAYQQASSCLDMNKENQYVYNFEDLAVSNLVNHCLKQYSKEFYCHPIIQIVKDYDNEYDTKYFETLRCYLNNLGNMKETSEQLNVHYNTMKYRILMIEKIIDRDLRNDSKLMILLYLSMMIYQN